MSAKNKIRGNSFEREVVQKLMGQSIQAKRAWGSDGRSMGEHEEVDIVIDTNDTKYLVQCKRRKKISEVVKPNKNVHFQIFKEDRGEIFVTITLNQLMTFIKHSTPAVPLG